VPAGSTPSPDSFEALALPHFDALYSLALHLTRNRRDAEDLVQEAFLKAFRFFDSFEPGTHMRAWLFRILRNTFINTYRKAKVRPQTVDLSAIDATYDQVVEETFLRQHRPASPEDVLMSGVLDEEVDQALADLPEEYRSVVVLALIEDLSYKEIAAALSIPIGTVMSRLHRGRRILQTQLLEYAQRRGIVRGDADVAKG
jgi:RNA polymerase sigma-70 factor (ECF subfamily)